MDCWQASKSCYLIVAGIGYDDYMNFPIIKDVLLRLADNQPTPLFVYSKQYLTDRAAALAGQTLPYGWTPRYAVKANGHPEIIKIFAAAGLHFDASSSYEAIELLEQGIAGEKISLSSQQPAHNLEELLDAGVQYVATSLHQLELFIGTASKGAEVGLRVNPGMGSGHNNRTTTGGANSSFGLWHTYVPQALELAKDNDITITRLHVHVGSGADPKQWGGTMDMALELAASMPNVTSLDIGGGYKIHRYGEEQETDMAEVVAVFSERLQNFAAKTGRKLNLEVEPGTWLVAHAGVLLAEVTDIVDTGSDGHTFLRLNTGMNDIIRPSMYGAQHRIEALNDVSEIQEYVIVGHNCETGDILSPAPGDPEGLAPRMLNKVAIGDIVVIHDTGAYCASFAAKGYNSFPDAAEVIA